MEQSIDIANSLFQDGNLEEAIDCCDQILASGKDSFEAYKLIGKCFFKKEYFPGAIYSFRKALDLNPQDLETLKYLGNIYQMKEDMKLAKEYYLSAISIDQYYSPALTNAGSIELLEGNIKNALKYQKRAIIAEPTFSKAWSNIANCYLYLERFEVAKYCLNKSLTISPNFYYTYFNLGLTYQALGDLEKAEETIRIAIDLKPDLFEAHIILGSYLVQREKLSEAEKHFRIVLKGNTKMFEANLNLGAVLHLQGKLKCAKEYTLKAINLDTASAEAYSNLSSILKDLGELFEAERYARKSIECQKDYSMGYLNLGAILKDFGKLDEAKKYTLKAINITPNFAKAFFTFSTFKYNDNFESVKEKLFSRKILLNLTKREKIDIYFARANIMHQLRDYENSSKYLKLANHLKSDLFPSDSSELIKAGNKMLIEAKNNHSKQNKTLPTLKQFIFIVGMPRSGSTLIESIISMNKDVFPLGEANFFEEALLEFIKLNKKDYSYLYQLYIEKTSTCSNEKIIFTDKFLYNYQYAGLIARVFPNVKIIHCYRHPLDNVLSLFRANFARGNNFSSSISDSAELYLNQKYLMQSYKSMYPLNLYQVNYDDLVAFPQKEIRSLIDFVGFVWDDCYLSPHLNTRIINTASNVEARFPINSNSVGGWRNYKNLLQSAIDVFKTNEEYKNIIS